MKSKNCFLMHIYLTITGSFVCLNLNVVDGSPSNVTSGMSSVDTASFWVFGRPKATDRNNAATANFNIMYSNLYCLRFKLYYIKYNKLTPTFIHYLQLIKRQ